MGDKIVQINGVDVTDARHDQAVQMLTGLEKFVRLVVERDSLVPRSQADNLQLAPGQDKAEKSPKVFGVPKPYTGLYSASSYMANRPSYGLRNREPGNYTLNSSQTSANEPPQSYNANNKLPGLGGIPGENKSLPPHQGLLTTARSSGNLINSTQNLTNQQFDAMIPEAAKSKMSTSMSSGKLPTVKTESITKTTFTETTVKRVTASATIEQVSLKRSGGPLGLSIIGGSDHSCVPFGTGEQVRY